ncbi:MAG: hypothetical protein LBV04_09280 [Deferribacteraceae bacterium]|jgi:hypothetical protein|nr:hypothetical protein [Deferribacteraceae bacterium]
MTKIKELENIASFSEIYKHIDASTAVLVRNDGEADIAVLSGDIFEEFMIALKVNEGFKAIEEGRFLEHEQVKANFEAKYGKL